MDELSLFDAAPFVVEPPQLEPVEELSADRKRTLRQLDTLAKGVHPLAAVAGRHLKLHSEAAPHDDRNAPGRRCGSCWYFKLIYTNGNKRWPKCLFGAENPTDTNPYHGAPPRVSRSSASDVRRWWPGCTDHVYGDPAVSDDAARWVPEVGIP